eukprot:4185667-Prorocentrum_lima.AAC.1
MTSSLVGSEMCIRDSWKTLAPTSLGGIGCSYKARTKEGAGSKSSSGLLSVLAIMDQQSHLCVGKAPCRKTD